METRRYIDSALDRGYQFRASDYLSRGWKTFTDNPGGYLGYGVLFMVITVILAFIPIIGQLVSFVISPPLSVGIPIAAHKQNTQGNTEFGNFFRGFDYLGQLLIAYLIQMLIYLIIALPIIIVLGYSFVGLMTDPTNPDNSTAFAEAMVSKWPLFLITFLVMIYVGVSLRWTNMLIVFHKYDAVDAIKTSWKLVGKNWFAHLGFVLLMAMVILLGFIALFVGIFVAFPVIMAADYAGYADISGLDKKDSEISDIGRAENLV